MIQKINDSADFNDSVDLNQWLDRSLNLSKDESTNQALNGSIDLNDSDYFIELTIDSIVCWMFIESVYFHEIHVDFTMDKWISGSINKWI